MKITPEIKRMNIMPYIYIHDLSYITNVKRWNFGRGQTNL